MPVFAAVRLAVRNRNLDPVSFGGQHKTGMKGVYQGHSKVPQADLACFSPSSQDKSMILQKKQDNLCTFQMGHSWLYWFIWELCKKKKWNHLRKCVTKTIPFWLQRCNKTSLPPHKFTTYESWNPCLHMLVCILWSTADPETNHI